MKLGMISDLHSNLNFKVEPCDLLLIAGDLCPAQHNEMSSINLQAAWLNINFMSWFNSQPVKEGVAVFGNHDWIGESSQHRIPKMPDNFRFLQDESIELFGLKIYGTPWQLSFNNWAFNLPEERLKLYWENIPEDTDILLCHSPPHGILDTIDEDNFNIGSKTLLKRIMKIKPKIVVFGHNHNQNGVIEIKDITFVNCSLLNEQYRMVNRPIYKEIKL